jgi:hypothetical protein
VKDQIDMVLQMLGVIPIPILDPEEPFPEWDPFVPGEDMEE